MGKRRSTTLHQSTEGSATPSRKSSRNVREKNARTSARGPASNTTAVVAFIAVFAALIFLTGNFSFSQNDTENNAPVVEEKEDAVVPNEEQDVKHVNQAQEKGIPAQVKAPSTEVPARQKDEDEFKGNFLSQITIKTTGLPVTAEELTHNNEKSSVRAYVINGLLTPYECDQLIRVHRRHTEETTLDPILCFSDITTLRKHLQHANVDVKVSEKDFTVGTKCLNESLSASLKPHFKWSYSTAFYPGESKFSSMYADRIQKVTGMPPENGGKFQITSYPNGVAYKNHTDCIVGSSEKRDRFATILVYLQDVDKGGETHFPELGIRAKPQKGRGLVWNSMDTAGNCDPTSIHNSSHVEVGHKYIIQRWYYYKSFPSLGKRVQEPQLPPRKPQQPRVMCDEYEFGSCRWYDEWNYDHLTEYPFR